MNLSDAYAEAESVSPEEFRRPIALLRSAHDRQRTACARLSLLIDTMPGIGFEKAAAAVLDCLSFDVPLNVEDEEELLAPALRRRCGTSKVLDATLAHSRRDHRTAAGVAARTCEGLDRLAQGYTPVRPLDFVVSALELLDLLEDHLDWEDRALLPLAETSLTMDDLARLGRDMARRRGVACPQA